MGKEFVSLHASLGPNFDLSEGLKPNSLNIVSIQSHGPSGTTTSASSALADLNKLSSSSTKYTIIDIKDDQPEDDQPSVTGIVASGIIENISGQGTVVTSAVNCSLKYNGGNYYLLTLSSGTINKIFFHDLTSNNYHVRLAPTRDNNLGGRSIMLTLGSFPKYPHSARVQFMVI